MSLGCVYLTLAVGVSMFAVGSCGNYTVTDEAWFEVEIKDFEGAGMHYRGRFTIALFGEVAPMTVMNFRAIAQGYQRGKDKLQYKNSPIHRVVKDFVLQMGDITVGDGSGGTSIFGEKFNDEEFVLGHVAPGMVSMANKGKDSNGSQFFITIVKARWMDGKHVVFGKVIKGFNDVLDIINNIETDQENAFPLKKIRIVDCGLNDNVVKYDLTRAQVDATDDIL